MSDAAAVAPRESSAAGINWVEIGRLAGTTVQFGAVVLLVRLLQLGPPGLANLMLLALGGFVVHALLPLRYRLPFFLGISVAGVFLVLGAAGGGWLLGLGCLLIGVMYLPLSYWVRVGLLAALLACLAALRASVGPTLVDIPAAVWPALGALFMLRMFIFLYDVKHAPKQPDPVVSLSYFFLIPNIVFPLFPTVDFKTFERSHFEGDRHQTYQRGLHWMVRGLTHLVAYRLVYHHLQLDATDVRDAGDILQYVVTAFLLYFRISGIYHLSVGLLLLFGFRLPETFHLYWMSASFIDMFRRTNIYWKDAMMKLVYYPSFFRLRSRGNTFALVLSLMLVFAATWASHSWQWFWLRGKVLFSAQDTTFYLMLGSLVAYEALRESRQRTKLPATTWSLPRALGVCRTMFLLSLLWSYWSADSIGQWLGIWHAASVWNLKSVALLVGLLALGLSVGGLRFGAMDRLARPKPGADLAAAGEAERRRSLVITLGCLGGLALLANPLLPRWVNDESQRSFLETLRSTKLSRRDEAILLKGYYEQIDNPALMTGQLGETYAGKKPDDWIELTSTDIWVRNTTPLLGEMRPNVHIMWRRQPFSTNQWGMRDKDYPLVKPPRTYRIALVGASDGMGAGVGDGENFESFFEQILNQKNLHTRYDTFEVMNFSASRTAMFQRAWVMDHKVAEFKPDLVLVEFHAGVDAAVSVLAIARVIAAGADLEYPLIKNFLASEPAAATKDTLAIVRALMPKKKELFGVSLQVAGEVARRQNLSAILLGLRQPTDPEHGDSLPYRQAEAAGLEVIDISDYEGKDETAFRLAAWDKHPSMLGHKYLADRLYREFAKQGRLAALGVAEPAAP